MHPNAANPLAVIAAWLTPEQKVEGARLDALRITSATEGAVIPRVYGRMRVGGKIIWATSGRIGEEIGVGVERGHHRAPSRSAKPLT